MKQENESTCRNTVARFPDVEAGLAPLEEIQPHIDDCAACREDWDFFVQLLRGAAPASAPDPEGAAPGYWEAFLPRLRARIAAGRLSASANRGPAWVLPAAAALVLGFCLGAGVTSFVRTEETPSPMLAATVDTDPVIEDGVGDTWREDLLLPLPSESPWEESLYDGLLEGLDAEERMILEADILEELS